MVRTFLFHHILQHQIVLISPLGPVDSGEVEVLVIRRTEDSQTSELLIIRCCNTMSS
jgi:hypothetical protein